MGIVFTKLCSSSSSRVTEQDKAVLQLKQQRDKLKQYQKRIETKLASDRELAKKLLNDNKKERAMLLLRKKRYQEQLLVKTDGQLENIERLTHDIEFAQIEVEVVAKLKQGNESLKKINEVFSIGDIERILDETKEGYEKQQEIDAMLSGVLTTEDEDAVEQEYNELIRETMPNVPTEIVETNESDEEEVEPASASKKEIKEKNIIKEAIPIEA